MKRRTYLDYVNDILLAISDIEDFTKGMDFSSFSKDKKTINAVIRSLEVMGEAAKKIPKEIRDKYSEIPFKSMAGIRDKLIHEYHGIDLDIIWNVIKLEIPHLKPKLEKLLEEMQDEEGI